MDMGTVIAMDMDTDMVTKANTTQTPMEAYFTGKVLYGDDFSLHQIREWYEQEKEAYSDLGGTDRKEYTYTYDAINRIHGFDKIKDRKRFEHALGFGAAFGMEFLPVIDKISNLTIIEPSDNLRSARLGSTVPTYVKPEVSGAINFKDNSFDLITCFGTLHHLPNVSFVTKELIRVLKPDGFLLLREPIISMGDWRVTRNGLTRNERGIPLSIFEDIFADSPVTIVNKAHCFTLTAIINRSLSVFSPKHPLQSYPLYVRFDKILSRFLSGNVHYHARRMVDKLAPSNIFFVLKKTAP